MEKHGYGPDKRLAIKVSTRNIPPYRDPAVILLDQLKANLHRCRTRAGRQPELVSQGGAQGLYDRRNLTGYGVDDPDQTFYENFACGSENNYDGYCNPEIDKLFDEQSMQSDQEKRKKLVWEIERRAGGGRCPPGALP